MLRWSSFGQQFLKWREYDRHSSFILLRHDSLGHWDTLTFPTTWWWWSRRRGRLWPRGDRFSSFFEYIPVTDLCVLMMEYVIGSKSGVGAVYGRSKRSWRFSHRHKWVPIITGSVGSDRTCVCVCSGLVQGDKYKHSKSPSGCHVTQSPGKPWSLWWFALLANQQGIIPPGDLQTDKNIVGAAS